MHHVASNSASLANVVYYLVLCVFELERASETCATHWMSCAVFRGPNFFSSSVSISWIVLVSVPKSISSTVSGIVQPLARMLTCPCHVCGIIFMYRAVTGVANWRLFSDHDLATRSAGHSSVGPTTEKISLTFGSSSDSAVDGV